MIVGIDDRSPVPPYEQLRGQIAAAIDEGQLQAEDRLPTVRELAADLRLAVNTVARAYRELEASGRVETRGRNGTFVAGAPSPARQQAEQATKAYAQRMRRLGLGPSEILATLRKELEAARDPGSSAGRSARSARPDSLVSPAVQPAPPRHPR